VVHVGGPQGAQDQEHDGEEANALPADVACNMSTKVAQAAAEVSVRRGLGIRLTGS